MRDLWRARRVSFRDSSSPGRKQDFIAFKIQFFFLFGKVKAKSTLKSKCWQEWPLSHNRRMFGTVMILGKRQGNSPCVLFNVCVHMWKYPRRNTQGNMVKGLHHYCFQICRHLPYFSYSLQPHFKPCHLDPIQKIWTLQVKLYQMFCSQFFLCSFYPQSLFRCALLQESQIQYTKTQTWQHIN